ncbi:hypothetical protein LY76DRAFT_46266 [Colletotrichum caudatum]|nr:hypothetical protein LY76DRAFT_46266 [Colletotrichum caudatum]
MGSQDTQALGSLPLISPHHTSPCLTVRCPTGTGKDTQAVFPRQGRRENSTRQGAAHSAPAIICSGPILLMQIQRHLNSLVLSFHHTSSLGSDRCRSPPLSAAASAHMKGPLFDRTRALLFVPRFLTHHRRRPPLRRRKDGPPSTTYSDRNLARLTCLMPSVVVIAVIIAASRDSERDDVVRRFSNADLTGANGHPVMLRGPCSFGLTLASNSLHRLFPQFPSPRPYPPPLSRPSTRTIVLV